MKHLTVFLGKKGERVMGDQSIKIETEDEGILMNISLSRDVLS